MIEAQNPAKRYGSTVAVDDLSFSIRPGVESDFRQTMDRKIAPFSPMFCWTQSKIRVHVFCCVLARVAARLMVREADRAGLHVSARELLARLA